MVLSELIAHVEKKNELESLPYTIRKTIPGRVNILEWKAQLYKYFNL